MCQQRMVEMGLKGNICREFYFLIFLKKKRRPENEKDNKVSEGSHRSLHTLFSIWTIFIKILELRESETTNKLPLMLYAGKNQTQIINISRTV